MKLSDYATIKNDFKNNKRKFWIMHCIVIFHVSLVSFKLCFSVHKCLCIFFVFLALIFFFFLTMLGLRRCLWAFSNCGDQVLLSTCDVQASHCGGFSCCRAQALSMLASVAAVCRL